MNSNAGNEFRIFDITDPSSPVELGGAGFDSNGGNDVFVSGRYAYMANSNAPGKEFLIYDVSDPSSPTEVGGVQLGTQLNGVFVSGRYAYMVGNSFSGNEFLIYDISDPSSPTEVGGAELGTHSNGVFVSGRYAYVVHGSVAGNDFRIYDISDPSSPTEVGGADLGAIVRDVFVSGRYAYVVHDSDGGAGNDFRIYDISDPSSPTEVGGADLGADGNDVFVSGRYAYVVNDSVAGNDFRIFDVSDPSSPTEVGGAELGNNGFGVFVSGRYAYVVHDSVAGNEFRIFDVTGIEATSAIVHSLEAGSLQVRESALINNQLTVSGGLGVGMGGIYSQGPVAITWNTTSTLGPQSATSSLLTLTQTQFGSDTSTRNAILTIQNASSTAAADAYINFAIAGTSKWRLGFDDNDADKFRITPLGGLFTATSSGITIDARGFVGIGTTNPTSSLAIAGVSTTFNGLTYGWPSSGITADDVLTTDANGVLRWGSAAGGWTDDGAVVRLTTATDKVGIGSATADYKLDVTSADSSSTTLAITNTGGGDSILQFEVTNGEPTWMMGIDNSDNDVFRITTVPFNTTTTGLTIMATSGIAYVGIGTTNPQEMFHVDAGNIFQSVGIGPASTTLQEVGGADLGGLGRGVFVSGRYAYVVHGEVAGNEFRIFDVSTSTPTQVGGADLGAEGWDVFVSGRYAYVVSGISGNDFRIYDISDLSSPLEVGGVDFGAFFDGLGVFVSGRYAYVVNEDSISEVGNFLIFDISDPTNPTEVGGVDVGTAGRDVFVSGRYAYVVNNSVAGNEFRIFDVSDPTSPTEVGGVDLGTHGRGVFISGRYAYVVNNDGGSGNDFRIFDVSDPSSPAEVGGVDLGVNVNGVFVSGRYAYVAHASVVGNDFRIYDVSDPSSPVEVGGAELGTTARGVFVSGRYAYVVHNSVAGNDLRIYDITGLEVTSAIVHSLEAGSLQVRESALINNQLTVTGGITAGMGGIYSQGPVAITWNTTSTLGPQSATSSLLILTQTQLGSDTATRDAILTIQNASSTAAADAYINFAIAGTSKWRLGFDDSDGDKFRIATTTFRTWL